MMRPAAFARTSCAVAMAMACAVPARADTPAISVTADRELAFGTFMIFGSGSRTVTASGAVSDSGLVPLEGAIPAPAHFTISYDRGNASRNVLDIELELVINAPPMVRQGGVEARLSAYQSDLPEATLVTAGRPITLRLRDCRTRICSRTFRLGGRLDVTRHFGGAQLVVPIPVDVAVIDIDRRGN